jgi:5-formyltetrahydrofolate cyclo-ligase
VYGGRRHDHDAGGSAELQAAKAGLREQVWGAMAGAGVARFPGAEGRIPNFVGAELAAELLRGTAEWQQARTIKANPDAAQWPVRQRALQDGKRVLMAVPRLAEPEPFYLLDPEDLADPPRAASSITGAARSARRVGVDAVGPVDLVVCGCVAVAADGSRLGKGGGFADLEFAVASDAGLLGPDTPVATTVHELQLRRPGEIPLAGHDVLLDLIITPQRVIDCRPGRPPRQPATIHWTDLTEEKIAAIPLLTRLRPQPPH